MLKTASGWRTANESCGRCFQEVGLNRYPDELHVTDTGPVMDYINSTGRKLNDRQASEIRRRIQDRIDCDGKFVIRKASGILTARK